MAKAHKSYKTQFKPKGAGQWADCDSRFATEAEGEALAAELKAALGEEFETSCVDCDEEVNARYTKDGLERVQTA